jgi:hypothetical protein
VQTAKPESISHDVWRASEKQRRSYAKKLHSNIESFTNDDILDAFARRYPTRKTLLKKARYWDIKVT